MVTVKLWVIHLLYINNSGPLMKQLRCPWQPVLMKLHIDRDILTALCDSFLLSSVFFNTFLVQTAQCQFSLSSQELSQLILFRHCFYSLFTVTSPVMFLP